MCNCGNAVIILELITEYNLTCVTKDIENRGGILFTMMIQRCVV